MRLRSLKVAGGFNSQGFTFVELLLAMALFSFMFLIVGTGVIGIMRIYDAASGVRSTQQSARDLAEEITRYSRDAVAVEARHQAQALTIQGDPAPAAVPHDRVCFYTSNTKQQGTMFFSLPVGSPTDNRYNVYRSVVAGPAGSCSLPGPGVMREQVNSNDVSVLTFGIQVPPAASGVSVVTYTSQIASINTIQPGDLIMDGASPTCADGFTQRYCSLTTLSNSAAIRGAITGLLP